MNKQELILALLIFTPGCDDNKSSTNKPILRDAAVVEDMNGDFDSNLPVEYYDFDTISIEADDDFGLDLEE